MKVPFPSGIDVESAIRGLRCIVSTVAGHACCPLCYHQFCPRRFGGPDEACWDVRGLEPVEEIATDNDRHRRFLVRQKRIDR